jgi:DNA-binding transcriptional regulator/RsmH inhibitor MraZ
MAATPITRGVEAQRRTNNLVERSVALALDGEVRVAIPSQVRSSAGRKRAYFGPRTSAASAG